MKPIYAKVLEGLEDEVFTTRLTERPYFTTEFHFHVECQMTYIVKSAGHKVVGDCVENFEPGEVTLLGSHIPHVWYNHSAEREISPARSVALFFHPEKLTALLSGFFNVKKLKQVLELAGQGMKFYGRTKDKLEVILLKMADKSPGPGKLILLLEIIELLCTTGEYTLLAGAGYVNTYTSRDNARMDKVFKYVFDHYSSTVSLDDVAALIHMNKQAFCRYFKGHTQKTFVDFVNEVRITHACKLIAAGQQSIGEIAYQCGFNSLTNFNRCFKRNKGMAPRDYKMKLAE